MHHMKKKMLHKIGLISGLAAIMVLSLFPPAPVIHGATTSGQLTIDETWSGTVVITGDVTVPAWVTLTIEPGTQIVFAPLDDDTGGGSDATRSELIVTGSLVAQGTAASPILFTSGAVSKAKGDWGGIFITWTGINRTLQIRHCEIEYAQWGIEAELENGTYDLTIADTVISQTAGDGIYISGSNEAGLTVDLGANTITGNDGQGIHLQVQQQATWLSGTVSGNTVSSNGAIGLHVETRNGAYSDLVISDNTVSDNQGDGVYLYHWATYGIQSSYEVNNNTIYRSGVGINLYNYQSSTTAEILDNEVYESSDGIFCYNNGSYALVALVAYNNVHDNSGRGIYGYSVGTGGLYFTVGVNEVYQNTGDGIECAGNGTLEPVIGLNSIYNNGGDGISCLASAAADIIYNDISNNAANGIDLQAGDGSTVNYNNIYGSGGDYELRNGGSGSVDSRFNYWGDAVVSEMAAGGNPKNIGRIYDIYDNVARGTVYYDPWFSTPLTLPTGPVSHVTWPVDGSAQKSTLLKIAGVAISPNGVKTVEVSPDSGVSWYTVEGTESWQYQWQAPGDGSYTILSRITDEADQVEVPGAGVTVTVDSTLPTTTGVVTADETWSGVVTLTGDVTVPSGVTLTIAPGTELRFSAFSDDQAGGSDASRSELIVLGSLVAAGTETQPIVFTSSSSTPTKGHWYGIEVLADGSDESVTLSYCTIEYASQGISIASNEQAVAVSITDSEIRQTSGDGISIFGEQGAQLALDLSNNRITDNDGRGINCFVRYAAAELSGTIGGNSISGSGGAGLYVETNSSARSDLIISDNTIYDNQDNGILLYNYATYSLGSVFQINDNTIYNSGVGIYVYPNYSAVEAEITGNDLYDGTVGIRLDSLQNSSYPLRALVVDNDVHDNSSWGIYGKSSNNGFLYPVIRYNRIYSNDGDGIRCERPGQLEPVITLNSITDNGGNGIYCQASAATDIIYNDIRGSAGDGIYLEAGDGSTVNYNNIYGSGGDSELINGSSGSLDGRFNYWGDAVIAEMATGDNPKNIGRIFDIYDNAGRGTVYYDPWISAALTLPPAPVSHVTWPVDSSAQKNAEINISGVAVSPSGVKDVAVSLDSGATWQTVEGKESWQFQWQAPGDGSYTILSRITDEADQVEVPGAGVTVTVDSTLPTTTGVMNADEIWSGAVTLTGDVTVPAGVKLTIAAGTEVRFSAFSDDQAGGSDASRSELTVHGSLTAAGTDAQRITFTSSSDTPAKGDWYGIEVVADSSDESVSLSFCTIEYASQGISITANAHAAAVSITDSDIRHTSGDGVNVYGEQGAQLTVDLRNNRITDNDGRGINGYVRDSTTELSGVIDDNAISNSMGVGLYVETTSRARSNLTISNNRIFDNQDYGISLYNYATYSDLSMFYITENTIYNSGVGINVYPNSSAVEVEATGNDLYNGTDGIYLNNYFNTSYPLIALMADNDVHDNSGRGIYCYASNNGSVNPEIRGNRIYNNNGHGVELTRHAAGQLDTVITLNSIYNNGGNGIFCQASAAAEIIYNDIYNNAVNGVYLDAGDGSKVNYNNIYGSGGDYELINGGSGSLYSRFNYWGDTVVAEMAAGGNPKNIGRIYDIYDDGAMGTVYYDPWNSAALTLPTASISHVTWPVDGDTQKSSELRISGAAVSPNGVKYVEVSPDNGVSWYTAEGAEGWWSVKQTPGDGSYTILSRVIDKDDQIETPGAGVTVTVDSALPTTTGVLTADETWSGAVTLTGDVTVPAGVTLTIAAGTELRFLTFSDDQAGGSDASRAELIVHGSLAAAGTEAQPISFTSSATAPAKGDWYGIRVLTDSSDESISLSFCTIEYASQGISIEADANAAAVSITECDVRQTAGEGITISGEQGARLTVDLNANRITDNDGRGIDCNIQDTTTELIGTIVDNTISNNGDYGLSVETYNNARADLAINDNRIFDNQTYGIYLNHSSIYSVQSHFRVSKNTIYNNGTGIYANHYYSTMTIEITGNDLYGGIDGIYVYTFYNSGNPLRVLIADNEVHENSSEGIYCYAANNGNLYPEIRGNRIYLNNSYGVALVRHSNGLLEPVVALNSITDNGGYGIYNQASVAAKILFNNIHGNQDFDLYNASEQAVDARYNHWGDATTTWMASSGGFANIPTIYDIYDDDTKGRANYLYWSVSPIDSTADLVSEVADPAPGAVKRTEDVLVEGIAHADKGISRVEVSLDNGNTWHVASADDRYVGKTLWRYLARDLSEGNVTILSKVVDTDDTEETPANPITVTIDKDATLLAGTLEFDQTWSGTVQLQGDVTVPEGVTLTVLPGTTVLFPALFDTLQSGSNSSKSEFIVRGTLIAEGTGAAPIAFTSDRGDNAAAGDWVGIYASGSIRLRHAGVEYGEYGIRLEKDEGISDILVEASEVRYASEDGIRLMASNNAAITATIRDSRIADNSGSGLSIRTEGMAQFTATICGNDISSNGDSGVHLYTDAFSGGSVLDANICNNMISGHATYGIYSETRYSAISRLTVEHNDVSDSGTGLYTVYNTAGSDSTLHVTGNAIHNGYLGIAVYNDYTSISPQILYNEIYANSTDGIDCWVGQTSGEQMLPYIEGNHIYGNGDTGIYLKATGEVTVVNNGIYNNTYYAIYNDASFTINAAGNWWGVATTNEMNAKPYPSNIAKIYDSFDDTGLGLVAYDNWLLLYEIPNPPTLDAVTSPTADDTQLLSGTKDPGTAIVLNNTEVVPLDGETNWSYSMPLSEGNNIVNLSARSTAGMSSMIIVSSIILDTTAPVVYSSVPADGSSVPDAVNRVDITLLEESTAIDPTATLAGADVRDAADAAVAGQWTIEYNHVVFTPEQPLDEGAYTVTLNPTDAPLGNTRNATISFSVDLTAPAALSLNPVVSPTTITSQNISGTKEGGTSVWLNDNQIVPADDLTTWSYSLALTDGTNTGALHARDRAGNQSQELEFTIVLDRYPPVLLSTEPANNSFVQQSPANVTFYFSDAATSLAETATLDTASIQDSSFSPVAGTWQLQANDTVVFTPAAPFPEDTYTVSIQAQDLVGNTVFSSIFFTFDITAPATPVLFPVQSPTNFAVQTLSGTKEADSAIWINGAVAVPVNPSADWSYQISLTEGDNLIEIYAKDAAGNQSGSVFSTIVYDETAPLPVSNLTVDGQGPGTAVLLDWTGYDEQSQGDIESYRVYAENQLFTQVAGRDPITTLPAGTFIYTVSSLSRDTLYYFAVVAVDTKDNANNSVTPLSAVTVDIIAPEDVTNLRVVSTNDSLNFLWGASANTHGDLAGYRVYFNGDTQGAPISSTLTNYERINLDPATAYPFKIAAFDTDNNESTGATVTGVTLLPNPSNLTATPYSGYVDLVWEASQPAQLVKQYNVYVSQSDFSDVATMTPTRTTTANSAQIDGLTNDVTYYFAVTTVNLSDGELTAVTAVSSTPGLDSTGPELSDIQVNGIALADGHLLLKNGSFTLTATDYSGINRVEFLLDGSLVCTDTTGPTGFSCFLDINGLDDNDYTLSITAYDALDNATSEAFIITVNRPPPFACFQECIDAQP